MAYYSDENNGRHLIDELVIMRDEKWNEIHILELDPVRDGYYYQLRDVEDSSIYYWCPEFSRNPQPEITIIGNFKDAYKEAT